MIGSSRRMIWSGCNMVSSHFQFGWSEWTKRNCRSYSEPDRKKHKIGLVISQWWIIALWLTICSVRSDFPYQVFGGYHLWEVICLFVKWTKENMSEEWLIFQLYEGCRPYLRDKNREKPAIYKGDRPQGKTCLCEIFIGVEMLVIGIFPTFRVRLDWKGVVVWPAQF